MRLATVLIGLATGLLAGAPAALANPNGASVVRGQVSGLPLPGSNPQHLVIRNSPGAIINWQSFSIRAHESTRFVQQSAQSAVLNRVVGADVSQIAGRLSSNGRVFVVNPNGIVIHDGAVIDTAGLVASTLNISDADFIAGKLRFTDGEDRGAIVNQGFIKATDSGDVLLVAPSIRNEGTITTDGGNLVLAAGESVTITSLDDVNVRFELQAPDNEVVNLGELIAGHGAAAVFASTIRNSGHVSANALSVDAGGRVRLVAADSVTVEAGGRVSASGGSGGEVHIESLNGDAVVRGSVAATGSAGAGGRVAVLGERVGLFDAASVDVSGETGGGEALIGGDFQGANDEVRNATQTVLGEDATIRADAGDSGDGGTVIVWADEYTRGHGTISARGGDNGGNGGFVEVSGKDSLDFRAAVDTSAPNGTLGDLLLDPTIINVQAAGANVILTQVDQFVDVTPEPAVLDPALISAALATVTLQAEEEINFNEAISIAANGVGINADSETITVNAAIVTHGGAVNLTTTDRGQSADDTGIRINAPGSIDTTFGGAVPAGANIVLDADDAPLGGNVIQIDGTLNSGNSNITLNAPVWDVGGSGVMTGNLLTVTANGDVALSGANQMQVIDITNLGNGGGDDTSYATAIGMTINGISTGLGSGDVTLVGIGGGCGVACDFIINGNIAAPAGQTITLNTGGPGKVINSAGANGVGQANVSIPGTLRLTGGSLNFSVAANIGGDLEIFGGTLGGAGISTVTGSTTWDSGNVGIGHTLNANGGLVLQGATGKSVQGTINHTAAAPVAWSNTGTISGGGTFNHQSGTINNGGTMQFAAAFNNQGTLVHVSGGVLNMGALTNAGPGVVNVNNGTLELSGNGSNAGSITTLGGGTGIEVSFGTFTHTGSMNVAPGSFLRISGGTFDHNASSTQNGTLQLTGGELGGTSTFIQNGDVSWTAGDITVSPFFQTFGSTITINGTVNAGLDPDPTNIITDGASTVNWLGGDIIINTNTIWNAGGTYNINHGNAGDIIDGSDGTTFNLSGTLNKTLPGDITITARLSNSGGNVDIDAGTLIFNPVASDANNISYDIAPGAKLRYAGGNVALQTGSSFTGGGVVELNGGNISMSNDITFANPVELRGGNVSGANNFIATSTVDVLAGTTLFTAASQFADLDVQAGTVNFNNTADATLFSQSGGTVGGIGDLNIGLTGSWTGGTITGSGATVVESGATLTLPGGAGLTADRDLTIDGMLTLQRTLSVNPGVVITNNNLISIQTFGNLGNGGGILNNTGFITKTAGGAFTIDMATLNNSGTIQNFSDELRFGTAGTPMNGNHTAGAIVSSVNGLGIIFNGGDHTFDGTSTLQGAEDIEVRLGTITVQGTFSSGGGAMTHVNGGTLTLDPGVAISATNFLVDSGTLNLGDSASIGTMDINGGAVNVNANFNAITQTDISGGTMTLAAPATWTTPTLNIGLNGQIAGAGSITVNGTTTINLPGGAASNSGFVNSGTTTLNGNTNVSVGQNANFLVQNGLLVNNATFTISGSHFTSELIANNLATIQNSGGSQFILDGDIDLTSSGGPGLFQNAGTFQRINAGGISNAVGLTFDNFSVVDIDSGTLSLNGGGSHAGASFDVAAGTLLELGGGNHTSNPGDTFTGAGDLSFTSGTHTINGDITVTGQLILRSPNLATSDTTLNGVVNVGSIDTIRGTGGTTILTSNGATTVAGDFDASAGNVTVPLLNGVGGTFTIGSGTVTVDNAADNVIVQNLAAVNGNVTLTGDTDITVSGTINLSHGGLNRDVIISLTPGRKLIVQGGGTIDVFGVSSNLRLQSGDIEFNGGTVVFDGNDLVMSGGTTITNNAIFDIQTDEEITGTGTIVNNGIFKKTAGTETLLPGGITFTQNVGAEVRGESDTLTFTNPFVNNGTITTLAAGTVKSVGGFTNTATGKITGSGTIEGSIFNSGEIAPGLSPGVLTVLGNVDFLAGSQLTIELAAGLVSDQLVVSGGGVTIQPGAILNVVPYGGYAGIDGDSFANVIDVPGGLLNNQFDTIMAPAGLNVSPVYVVGSPGSMSIDIAVPPAPVVPAPVMQPAPVEVIELEEEIPQPQEAIVQNEKANELDNELDDADEGDTVAGPTDDDDDDTPAGGDDDDDDADNVLEQLCTV